ncbi:MAG: plasmid pRiA4b ORF-3 family protein [Blastochloris sp.]|nr:plasmid pRiA4b ORF-3 family protein [Blastochloris sp.]
MTHLSGIPGDMYQCRIWWRGSSPMSWWCLRVPATTHLAAFHPIMQQAFGWDDCHLHRFHMHGCAYGIWHPGTLGFRDDPRLIAFHFRPHERLVYEYDFGDGWQHEVRLEQVIPAKPGAVYPICTGGARAAPPENCGGPWVFLALQGYQRDSRVATR